MHHRRMIVPGPVVIEAAAVVLPSSFRPVYLVGILAGGADCIKGGGNSLAGSASSYLRCIRSSWQQLPTF